MGIQKDAGELLTLLYKKYIEDKEEDFFFLSPEDTKKETDWNMGRLIRALDYLSDREFIELDTYCVRKILPDGIDTVENEDKFKTTFGFGINIGVFNFSWSKEKK